MPQNRDDQRLGVVIGVFTPELVGNSDRLLTFSFLAEALSC